MDLSSSKSNLLLIDIALGSFTQSSGTSTPVSLQESTILRQRIDMLEIANQALFELIQERLSVSQDEVLNKMEIIRKRIEDEKIECPKCKRLMASSRETCSYCGAALRPNQPEDHWRP